MTGNTVNEHIPTDEESLSENDVIKVTGGDDLPGWLSTGEIATINRISTIDPVIENGSEDTFLYLNNGSTSDSVLASNISFTIINDSLPPEGIVTDSVLEELREHIDEPSTFTVRLNPEDVFNHLNADRPSEWKLDGNVKGITEGKIVLDVDNRFITVEEDLWLSRFGADEIVNVTVEDGQFVAELFQYIKFRRNIIEWIDAELPSQIYINSYNWFDNDPNVHLKLYCLFNDNCQVELAESGTPHRFTDNTS